MRSWTQTSGAVISSQLVPDESLQSISTETSQGASGTMTYSSMAMHELPLGGLASTVVFVEYVLPSQISTSSKVSITIMGSSPGQITRSLSGIRPIKSSSLLAVSPSALVTV